MTTDGSSEGSSHEETVNELQYKAGKGRYDDRGLSFSSRAVAFISWVVAAGLYGYLASEYGSASVDMASASPYPENAWLFMFFGAAVATAICTSVASMDGDDDE